MTSCCLVLGQLILVQAQSPEPALLDFNSIVHLNSNGADGADAVLNSDKALQSNPTAGGDGSDFQTTLNGASDLGVNVTSYGGAGGAATDFVIQPIPFVAGSVAGQSGGAGGDLTVSALNQVPFTLSQEDDFPEYLYQLLSAGGVGGAGSSVGGLVGSGGNGGNVTLTIGGSVFVAGGDSGAGNTLPLTPILLGSYGGSTGSGSIFEASPISTDAGITYEGGLNPFPTPAGGTGGDVSLTILPGAKLLFEMDGIDVTSQSDLRFAIQATSFGGDGGTGGGVSRGLEGEGYAGYGFSAGQAGEVNLTIDGAVSVSGTGWAAIYALSSGGSGGQGGADTGLVDQQPGPGGFGGDAGQANLTVGSGGSVSTSDDNQAAVILATIGGNGGSAGDSPDDISTFNYSVGAGGGNGFSYLTPNQPAITFSNSGSITTAGDESPAVIMQSIGGDGGNGSIGNAGGDGGDGGAIDATNLGTIATSGSYGFAMVGQSVGGIGGDGGTGNIQGGDGGDGGQGNAVTIENQGTITTSGEGAIGILAQSVGGGGLADSLAHLGYSMATAPGTTSGGSGGSATTFFLAQGGNAGTGGSGGAISVTNAGSLTTVGDNAPGIFLQSLGGGGGVGGSATADSLVISIAAGGDGGGGGVGGNITATNQAGSTISTIGLTSSGILAHSIGGGGGNGGNADSSAYSAGFAFTLSVGGDGGFGNTGGDVTIVNDGVIQTQSIDSHGIEAFSIGGSGGSGGQATSESNSLGTVKIPTVSISASVGGSGGSGGDGGDISITNNGGIVTDDDQSMGVYASSIGGGGGNGGNAASLATTTLMGDQINISVGIGGSGGSGGVGGDVTFTESTGNVTTSGKGAHGVFLASVGGGGGNGGIGDGTTDSATLAGESIGVAVSVGGNGGSQGSGGTVAVENFQGSVTTNGDDSSGMFLQSIGGGGGSAFMGGISATAGQDTSDAAIQAINAEPFASGGNADSSSGTSGTRMNVSVGGSGGGGGDGGAVSLTTGTSAITTNGDAAHGIHAQSIGGGGGNGGGASVSKNTEGTVASVSSDVVSAAKSIYSNTKTILGIASDYGSLATPAAFAVVGAGEIVNKAGLASDADSNKTKGAVNISMNVSLGGSGGIGGSGGTVTVDSSSQITTNGRAAHGIFTQSIGGGGGTAGTASNSGGSLLTLGLALGGDGGTGTDGGNVTVTNRDTLITNGDLSFGIYGQSIGGGGGAGGGSTSADKSYFSAAVNVDVGGDEGNTGSGGSVSITNTDQILTRGLESHAIVASSIGGGGGSFLLGLDAVQSAAANSSSSSGGSATDGSKIGIALKIGGKGAQGGTGGDVTVTNAGNIQTEGDQAFAIFAQSIGGGGGFGAGLPTLNSGSGAGSDGGPPVEGFVIAPTFPGSGGAGNEGGAVTVTLNSNSTIMTTGAGSTGIFAQSIGGGGGYSGAIPIVNFQTFQSLSVYTTRTTVAVSGDGGPIQIQAAQESLVQTEGTGAHGIFAQSIGGGGGATGSANGLLTDLGMDPNTIPPLSTTLLPGSEPGISLTPISPNDPLIPVDPFDPEFGDPVVPSNPVPSTPSVGGTIDVTWDGDIVVNGANAHGIFAQSGVQTVNGSVGAGTGSQISVTISPGGSVQGGSGSGAGIRIDGGSNNQITINGGSVAALSGLAIHETNANPNAAQSITNSGTLVGSILTSVPTQFANQSGGIFHPGSEVNLTNSVGGASAFINSGEMNIAGEGMIGTTVVTGGFSQASTGTWRIDVAPQFGAHDQMVIVSGEGSLSGTVVPVFQSEIDEAFDPIAIVVGDNLSVDAATLLAPLAFTIYTDDTESNIYLGVEFDGENVLDALPNLTANETNAADYVQSLWEGGDLGDTSEHVISLLGITSPAQYQAALQSFAPESHAVVGATAPNQASNMQDAVHSFPVFVGDTAKLSETSGVATKYTFSYLRHSSQGQISAYQQWDNAFQLNGQQRFLDTWFLGGAFIYNFSTLAAENGRSSAAGDSFFFGGVLKKILFDHLLLSGSVGYAFGLFDQERQVLESGAWQTATADQYVHTLSSRLRAAYNFDLGHWYVRPAFSLEMVYVNIPGYSESGGGALNMEFDAQDDFQVGLTPELEIGGRIDVKGATVRPFAKAGLTWWSDSDWEQSSSLAAAGTDETITTAFEAADVIGHAEVGFDWVFDNGIELRAQYDTDFADDFIAHSVSGRVGFRF